MDGTPSAALVFSIGRPILFFSVLYHMRLCVIRPNGCGTLLALWSNSSRTTENEIPLSLVILMLYTHICCSWEKGATLFFLFATYIGAQTILVSTKSLIIKIS
jgi:hypothetical protein